MRPPGDRQGNMRATSPIRYPRNGLCLLAAGLVSLVACRSGDPVAMTPATCAPDGHLQVVLHGAIRASLDWQSDQLSCEGMPRPEGRGARLRFSGPFEDAGDEKTVAIILGIPDLEQGSTGNELPTNVTLIEEGIGRFFGTQDTSGCWTDIGQQEPLADTAGGTYRIAGTVYCVSPLAELNGGSSINFTELSFAGQLEWSVPE
jgi:hypothetical protein